MYFESRAHAGAQLAAQLLEKYRYENCAVIALSDGGVLVAEQVASYLHCVMMLLMSEDIEIPGEKMSFGALSQHGDFTYNSSLSQGEVNAYTGEFHGYLEEQKRVAMSKMNRLVGEGGTVDREILRDHTIIVISDSFDNPTIMNMVMDFLKPVRYERLVVATPIATVQAVDVLHLAADELHILDVKENYMGVNHYYNDNTLPDHEVIVNKINEAILHWK